MYIYPYISILHKYNIYNIYFIYIYIYIYILSRKVKSAGPVLVEGAEMRHFSQ